MSPCSCLDSPDTAQKCYTSSIPDGQMLLSLYTLCYLLLFEVASSCPLLLYCIPCTIDTNGTSIPSDVSFSQRAFKLGKRGRAHGGPAPCAVRARLSPRRSSSGVSRLERNHIAGVRAAIHQLQPAGKARSYTYTAAERYSELRTTVQPHALTLVSSGSSRSSARRTLT